MEQNPSPNREKLIKPKVGSLRILTKFDTFLVSLTNKREEINF